MAAYYNEIDPFAVKWLRALIVAGHIADGEVDARSIADVHPDDLRGFTQHHFFAGIGGWSCALRLAGWPDDRPVWTGSCPCQPFSDAGRRKGVADERHLWPVWFRLIAQRRPAVVFGEQVASGAALAWLDTVSADLEGADYAVAAADLCAAGIGRAHIRQRLYWMGDAGGAGAGRNGGSVPRTQTEGCSERGLARDFADGVVLAGATVCGVADPNEFRRRAIGAGLAGAQFRGQPHVSAGLCAFIRGSDGKSRPIESGIEPLAHGIPARVGRLRGYGNAVVPQVAAAFISSYLDYLDLDTL